MTYAMLHGLGDCAPERHCGCLTMTPDPKVVQAMAERIGLTEERATAPVWEQCDRQDCSPWSEGLVVPGDEPTKPHAHGAARWVIKARLTTPWREVPDADA